VLSVPLVITLVMTPTFLLSTINVPTLSFSTSQLTPLVCIGHIVSDD
jgi:hypothetical protein